jgi:DNA polymerase-3 subunit delta'
VPCTLISENKFVDVVNIVPDGASLKIDQIRAVKDLVKFGPSQGKYQIVIISAADTLTPEAANSFLKVLEEPNERVVFILIVATLYSMLPTIKSRCHQIVFPDGVLPQNIAGPEIANLLASLGRRDLVALLTAAKDWARSPKDLDVRLNQLMLAMRENLRQRSGFGRAVKIVMQTIEAVKRKAAGQLALDAMFCKLSEEF